MCWRINRGDPLDNTGLILSRQRLFFFSHLTSRCLSVCRLFRIWLNLSLVQSIFQTTFLPLERSHCSTGYSSHSTTNTSPLTHYHTIQLRSYLSYSRHRAVSSLTLQGIETTAVLAVMVSNCYFHLNDD